MSEQSTVISLTSPPHSAWETTPNDDVSSSDLFEDVHRVKYNTTEWWKGTAVRVIRVRRSRSDEEYWSRFSDTQFVTLNAFPQSFDLSANYDRNDHSCDLRFLLLDVHRSIWMSIFEGTITPVVAVFLDFARLPKEAENYKSVRGFLSHVASAFPIQPSNKENETSDISSSFSSCSSNNRNDIRRRSKRSESDCEKDCAQSYDTIINYRYPIVRHPYSKGGILQTKRCACFMQRKTMVPFVDYDIGVFPVYRFTSTRHHDEIGQNQCTNTILLTSQGISGIKEDGIENEEEHSFCGCPLGVCYTKTAAIKLLSATLGKSTVNETTPKGIGTLSNCYRYLVMNRHIRLTIFDKNLGLLSTANYCPCCCSYPFSSSTEKGERGHRVLCEKKHECFYAPLLSSSSTLTDREETDGKKYGVVFLRHQSILCGYICFFLLLGGLILWLLWSVDHKTTSDPQEFKTGKRTRRKNARNSRAKAFFVSSYGL